MTSSSTIPCMRLRASINVTSTFCGDPEHSVYHDQGVTYAGSEVLGKCSFQGVTFPSFDYGFLLTEQNLTLFNDIGDGSARCDNPQNIVKSWDLKMEPDGCLIIPAPDVASGYVAFDFRSSNPDGSSIQQCYSNSSSGPSSGEIAGIAIGSIAFAALVALGIVFFARRRAFTRHTARDAVVGVEEVKV